MSNSGMSAWPGSFAANFGDKIRKIKDLSGGLGLWFLVESTRPEERAAARSAAPEAHAYCTPLLAATLSPDGQKF